MRSDHVEWATNEFGSAKLGDVRRTMRLVALAAEAAATPSGTVSGACRTSASREGAFRFVENEAVCPREVIEAMARAAAHRCDEKLAIVPVDATSLLITDETGRKGLGAVGSWKSGARGVHVMSALAVTSDGSPLGVCAQSYWVREARSKRPEKGPSTDVENRETRFWLRALEQTTEMFASEAPDCVPWFQLDRGADCGPVLAHAKDNGLLLTVRATHDRCVESPHKKLLAAVESTKVVMTYSLPVTAKSRVRKRKRIGKRRVLHWVTRRQARVAKLTLRYATVTLKVGRRTLEFNAVLVREKNRPKDDRIEWLLLTTRPVRTRKDALEIVRAYSYRWRIEEFHRTWKRGLCRVEDMQLRSRDAIVKWATILAAVAARALRLTYLARKEPDLLAKTEFTNHELKAIVLMREPKGVTARSIAKLTLSQVIRWVADLGGYTGPWNGPPGPTVVARGLRDVLVGAKILQRTAKLR
jgi:hypothetical protein